MSNLRSHIFMCLSAYLSLLAATESHAELSDPTRPVLFEATSEPMERREKLTLSAIWLGKSSKYATVNGITARQGETILNDIKIIDIQPKSITIEQHGSSKELYLFHKSVNITHLPLNQ